MRQASIQVLVGPLSIGGGSAACRDEANVLVSSSADILSSASAHVASAPQQQQQPLVSAATDAATLQDLRSRLMYTETSFLCELERGSGKVLSRCTPTELAQGQGRFSVAVTRSGDRHLFLLPLEEGRYMASISIPLVAWNIMGPTIADFLSATAITGYTIDRRVAAASAAPTYFPLDSRLKENAGAVQEALQQRVGQLGAVLAQVVQQQQWEEESAAASPPARRPSVSSVSLDQLRVLKRMCQERPSSARTSSTLAAEIKKLLRSATSSTGGAGALRSAILTHGMPATEKRFAVTAAACWLQGSPVYVSGGADNASASVPFERHLLPAALAVVLEAAEQRLSEAGSSGNTPSHSVPPFPSVSPDGAHDVPLAIPTPLPSSSPKVTVQCVAMHCPRMLRAMQRGCQSRGFVGTTTRPEDERLQATSAMCVSVASCDSVTGQSEWVVSVLLQASPVPYVGAPLSFIIAGLENLSTTQLRSSGFLELAHNHTAVSAMAISPLPVQRPIGLLTCSGVLGLVRKLRLLRRYTDGAVAATRDICLYSLFASGESAASHDNSKRSSHGNKKTKRSSSSSMKKVAAGESHGAPAASKLPSVVEENTLTASPYGARVEGVLQLCTRLANCRSRRTSLIAPCATSRGHPAPALQRSQTIFSIIKNADCTVLVQAMPVSAQGTSGSAARDQGIAFVVAELVSPVESGKVDLEAHSDATAYVSFTTWMLSKVL